MPPVYHKSLCQVDNPGRIEFGDVKSMGFSEGDLGRYAVEPLDLMVCEGGEPGRSAVYTGEAGAVPICSPWRRVQRTNFAAGWGLDQRCVPRVDVEVSGCRRSPWSDTPAAPARRMVRRDG